MNASSVVASALALAVLASTLSAQAAPPAGGSHCRFYSASDMSAALGRKMNIAIDSPLQCVYSDARDPGKTVVVQIHPRTPERIEVKTIRTTGEKLPNVDGEAYYDADLFGFAAFVGAHHVSVQTTIQPMPRRELIAIGTRIANSLGGR